MCDVFYILSVTTDVRDVSKTSYWPIMDDIKDVQRTDNRGKFIDGQSIRLNPFGNNRTGDRAYRRAERIVAALYLLTNHLEHTEVLRSTVRADAIALLDTLLESKEEMRAAASMGIERVFSLLRKLVSLMRVLAVAGHTSTQNAEVMIEALDELGAFLVSSRRSALAESVSLSREDLIEVRPASVAVPARRVKDIKDTLAVSDERTIKDRKQTGVIASVTSPISVRQQSIIEVLAAGGSYGIRDIAANLPEYSEKMIQRELAELVSGGHVSKSGLKRWSTYSLVRG